MIVVGALDLPTPVLLGVAVVDALLYPFYFGGLWLWSTKRWGTKDSRTWKHYTNRTCVIFVNLMMLLVLYAKLGFLLNTPFASADHENFAVRECIRILVGSESPYTQYLQ